MTSVARAFVYRSGVRIAGASITCDGAGSATDLVFLSSAQAAGGSRSPGRSPRTGRQRWLATDVTLTLLGNAGQRHRSSALVAPFGKPFVLGDLRLELLPTGAMPGSASLLIETKRRRLLYAGAVCWEGAAFGAQPVQVQHADAVCIDATCADPSLAVVPRAEALAQLVRWADEVLAAGKAPVVLAPPQGVAMDAAAALGQAGMGLRGHRHAVAASAAFRAVGVPVPPIARFQGALGPREVLLWPPEARAASSERARERGSLLHKLHHPTFAHVSPFSLDPEVAGLVQADAHIPLATLAGHAGLLDYVEATRAREVAVVGRFAESFARDLCGRGFDAYTLSPPRQMRLFDV
jgi:hypothetical protein